MRVRPSCVAAWRAAQSVGCPTAVARSLVRAAASVGASRKRSVLSSQRSVRVSIELTRTELVGSVDDLTAATANRVFGEFGFKPMANILREFVAEVRR